MDYGKYVDMAVQNPHGKEMIRLIQQPENFSRLVATVGNYRSILSWEQEQELKRKKKKKESLEEYSMKVLYAAIWAFGVQKITLSNLHYWRVHPLGTIRSPWGEIPMEIYMLDAYLENVIKPQCPW